MIYSNQMIFYQLFGVYIYIYIYISFGDFITLQFRTIFDDMLC